MNPFDGLAKYFLGRIEQKIYQQWTRFLFQIAVSMLGSFLFIGGFAMVTSVATSTPGVALVIGLGSGMVSAALALGYFLRRSPLTKGMMFVLPAEEATKELETNFQVIERN